MRQELIKTGHCLLLAKIKWLKEFVVAILMNFLGILVISCVIALIIASIGRLSSELGIYNSTAKQDISYTLLNQNISLHQFLNYFPSKADILSLAEVTAFLLLGILLLGIFKKEKGITILPFDVDVGDQNLSGKAIAEMIINELNRIMGIHKGHSGSMLTGNLRQITPNWFIKNQVFLPSGIFFKSEGLTQNIEAVGTFGLGSASIPLGSFLILIRQLCPLADPGPVVAGSLQKYGSEICLAAHMKWRNSSWSICQKIKKNQNFSHKDISCLIKALCFKIYFEQLNSMPSIRSAFQELMNGASKETLTNTRPSTWRVLKDFTEAAESLSSYMYTKDVKELQKAKKSSIKAFTADSYYKDPMYLLFNIGIEYLNLEKYYEAERLARYIVSLRPDSAFAWYSWGLALRMMRLDEEAILCYDKILELKESVEKNKIKDESKAMKAMSLRRLNRYSEAIYHFEEALKVKGDNGFIWGHYGLTLEANSEKDEIKIESAYQKAIDYFPEFISVYSALARIYRKKPNRLEDAKRMCKEAREHRQAIKDLNEYNRACFWINCNHEDKAHELLKIAVKKKQVRPQWMENDPDLKTVSKKTWFREMIKLDETIDVNDLISRAAVKEKLAKESGKNPSFFYKYDIKDPEKLAMKIIRSDNGGSEEVSKYLRERFPCEKFKKLDEWLSDSHKEKLSNTQNNKVEWEFLTEGEDALNEGLNASLEFKDLYDEKRFSQIKLSTAIKKQVEEHMKENKVGQSLISLNRQLLRATYQNEIGKNLTKPEICEKAHELIQNESEYVRARFYAVNGETNMALISLRRALKDKKISPDDVKFEPDFEFIQGDPHFQALLDEFSKDGRGCSW